MLISTSFAVIIIAYDVLVVNFGNFVLISENVTLFKTGLHVRLTNLKITSLAFSSFLLFSIIIWPKLAYRARPSLKQKQVVNLTIAVLSGMTLFLLFHVHSQVVELGKYGFPF